MVIKRSNSVNVRVKLSRWASAPTARYTYQNFFDAGTWLSWFFWRMILTILFCLTQVFDYPNLSDTGFLTILHCDKGFRDIFLKVWWWWKVYLGFLENGNVLLLPWSANLDKVPLLGRDAVLFRYKIFLKPRNLWKYFSMISKPQKSGEMFVNVFKSQEICGNLFWSFKTIRKLKFLICNFISWTHYRRALAAP